MLKHILRTVNEEILRALFGVVSLNAYNYVNQAIDFSSWKTTFIAILTKR